MKWILVILLTISCVDSFAMCVSSDTAYFRTGPGKSYSLSWTVGKYTPIVILDEKPGWYYVSDVDGAKHWAEKSVVSKRMKCATVRITKATLRTGPGTKYATAAFKIADKYFPFKIMTEKDNWYQVTDASGNKYWVHDSNIWRPRKVSKISF